MQLREQPTDVKPLYAAMTAAELLGRPPKEWTIPRLLPATGVAAIYGPTNVGKTLVAIDLLASIAEGGEFFGRKAKARGVVYVGLEGGDGIANRVRAWSTHNGRPLPDRARLILDQEFSLDNDQDVERMAMSIASFDLGEHPVIFIDTLSAAMMGLEENSSADMGAAMKRVHHLRRLTGGMVILIAHSGKDAAKGLRGSSKLPGDCDTIFQLKVKGGKLALVVEKQRDAKKGGEWTFEFHVVGEGDTASCVVAKQTAIEAQAPCEARTTRAAPAVNKHPQERLGPNEHMVIDVLTSARPGAEGMPESDLLRSFVARYKPGCRHSKSRFTDAVAGLIAKGRLIRQGDHLRLP